VIAENLHGLEIDERCTQIAAFALAMAAWTFDGTSGYRELPEMNLACSGLAPEGDLEDWETLAGDDERLQNGMRRLYSIFQDAPTLGSLIDPSAPENRLDTATFQDLEPLLREVLEEERNHEMAERGVVAYGLAKSAEMQSSKYHLVATNVPYLGKGKQSEKLRSYVKSNFPRSEADLATVFQERCLEYCQNGGCAANVTPQNWMYLISYEDLRRNLLRNFDWSHVSGLGPDAFSTQMWDFNTALFIAQKSIPTGNSKITGIDAFESGDTYENPKLLKGKDIIISRQKNQLSNPDARIILKDQEKGPPLSEYADSFQGIKTGDDPHFKRKYWEITKYRKYKFCQSTVRNTKHFGGLESVIDWSEDGYNLARRQGAGAWEKKGVAISQMNDLPAAIFIGEVFDSNIAPIIPYDEKYLESIWVFCSSDKYHDSVRRLDKKVAVANATVKKVPFNYEYWQELADEKYPNGLPAPYSDDPTQWIFHGHPKPSERPLQVAVARLLGYRWPAERDEDMDLSDEARECIERCKNLDDHVDDDGIVCIPPVQGERAAADRIRDLLADAYGDDWGEGVLQDLLDEWGYRSGGLQGWLDGATARQKGKFAQQHNKLFGHRPFIWHVSDEHEDGFSALVNYHQLDRANLERLTYTYLGDWIKQQEAAMERGDEGAEGRLHAAQDLQEELKNIIEGEPPYDIFVRWKEAHEQPIGWEPDLNDGVLLNIKPFIEAGILRDEPNVRYTKDRGKNPEGAPWGPKRYNRYEDVPNEYKLRDEDGEVIEHLTTEVKRRVQEQSG
jgi:hypothetical protein